MNFYSLTSLCNVKEFSSINDKNLNYSVFLRPMKNREQFKDAISKIFEKDVLMHSLFKEYGIPEEEAGINLFNDLLRSIVGQQLSVSAANTIYGRFLNLFNDLPDESSIIEIDTSLLRGAGLSGQKASYLKNVAVFFRDNQLSDTDWDKMSDEEIIKSLTQIKGVGPWTVQMLLMFTLNRQDVFPVDDLGIRMGMKSLYDINEEGKALKAKLESIADNWKPYRTIASKLIWIQKDKA